VASRLRAAGGLCAHLTYCKYNFFIKLMMKTIARKAGGPTDTSRDYEFTDWATVDRFVLDRVDITKTH